ncbi:MAG: NADP-dependent isocitrate dehydrogenase [Bacteroidetes bacterium]|nr:MAG: NADP-dependent isocitrate dehydrogenase [Bacteroidota bacterium]
MNPKIIYTKTDEAPALATASFFPVIEGFVKTAGIDVITKDISLSGRIISVFPEFLEDNQKLPDDLSELGDLVRAPEANIIKLPNISASVSQLQAAVKELQGKGFNLPDYPESPENNKDKELKARYDKIKGSAVNPVLREGNSDRRAPTAVKKYAMNHPHSMGEWSSSSKTMVTSMSYGDFYGSEKSVVFTTSDIVRAELVRESGERTVLKNKISVLEGEILDASVMSVKALSQFIKDQIAEAKKQDLLFSVHLKATMMKVSDPVIFGHVVSVFFEDVFLQYSDLIESIGFNPNNGVGDLISKLENLSESDRNVVIQALDECYKKQPDLAMVNSDKGITNLHVPSDIIIDASMPAAIRASGKMWNSAGEMQDMLALVPDRSYAGIYQETIDFCKKYGAFDPRTMGNVSNVGLMAQKAEEYGSHDKTFQIESNGVVQVIDGSGTVLMEQKVEEGDIFRMCQVKDEPVRDWVKLAVNRAGTTGLPTVFWLDSKRAHDLQIIKKVKEYLPLNDINGLDIRIMSPKDATQFSLQRIKEGKDTVSVTGNVLRDYLTDLFPILELGTSAKMLSIVPLMNGGGLFETGAGGSAPKHVQQFVEEGHLRWDSLGEFLALAVSLEHLGNSFNNNKALVLAETLNSATELFLENNKSPSRKVKELDNRGSHFYLTLYWAQALAKQNKDTNLKEIFLPLSIALLSNKDKVVNELLEVQDNPVELNGYYFPDPDLLAKAMRPSDTFNKILESIK